MSMIINPSRFVVSGSFLPTDLTVMPEWYKGDTGKTIATNVSVWADQGTNGNDLAQLTGTRQPVDNGTYLSFDGTDDYLEVPAAMSGTDVHVFMVASVAATNGAYSRIIDHKVATSDYNTAGAPILLEVHSSDVTKAQTMEALVARAVSAAGVFDATKKSYHSAVVGGVSTIFVNGVQSGTSGALSTTALTGLNLVVGSGFQGNTNGSTEMDLYELIYVRGAMIPQEIIDTENYLTTRHGL